jgi:hypothetical protein
MQDINVKGIVVEARGKGLRLPTIFEKLEEVLHQEGFSITKEEIEVDPYSWDDVTRITGSKDYGGTIEVLYIYTQTLFDMIRATISYQSEFKHLFTIEDKLSQALCKLGFEVDDSLTEELNQFKIVDQGD